MTRPQIARPWPLRVSSAEAGPSEELRAPAAPLVWGHRGASHAERQNSPAAFETAIAMGAHGVELDVRRTADDVLVVHHDADLSDGRLIVETAHADLPDWVPTLQWVLDLYRDLLVNIEVKSGAHEPDFLPDYPVVDLLLEVLALADPDHRHIVTSFDAEVPRRIQERHGEVATGLIFADPAVAANISHLAGAGYSALMANVRLIDARLVEEAHDLGLFVGAWTVNDPADMARMQSLGVDAVMTDVPDLALATLGTPVTHP